MLYTITAYGGTKNALPLITPDLEEPLKLHIKKTCTNLKIHIIELEVVDNHVHILISLKPSHHIPEIIKKLKGSSSYYINHILKHDDFFRWGRGYSIRTVSEKNLNTAIEYIRNQKKKHTIN